MKRFALNLRCHSALLASLLAVTATSPLGAATYYWDINPTTATIGNGTIDGGAGTWDNTLANFTTDSGDSTSVSHVIWSSGLMSAGKDTVVFGGASGGAILLNSFASGGQISSSTTLAVNNLTFNTSGYVLGGTNQIRFVNNGATGGSITVAPGVTAAVNNAIQGTTSGGLTSTTTGADGAVDTNVEVNGGGLLRLGGGNGSLGFTITGSTTVEVTGGGFSGFNLSTINAGSTLRTTASNVLPAPSALTGGGTLDLNGTSNPTGTIGGAMAVTNSTSTGSAILNLTLNNTATTHTGAISNGTGKISVVTTGTLAQGSGFSSTTGFATQTFAGANTYTGSTSHGRGTIALDFSAAAAPATNILYNGGFSGNNPTADDGKLIFTRPTGGFSVPAGAAAGSIATFTLTGKASTTNSQAFNGLRLDANAAAVILINPNATANTVALNLGTIERNSGSFINFATTNSTTALSSSATILTSSGTANGTLVDAGGTAYAVLGGREWAAKNAANDGIVAATYTNSTPNSLAGNASQVGGAANDVRLSADTSITTLSYRTNARYGTHVGGSTLTTGGILVSAAASSSGNFIGGGTLKPAGSDLPILNFAGNSRFLGINAVIANGTAGNTGVTIGGAAPSLFTAANTYTGSLNVHQNGLILSGDNTPSTVFINGGQTTAMGAQLPGGASSNATYLQLGYGNAAGSIGSAPVNVGVLSVFAVKRSDNYTVNSNITGLGGFTQAWSGTTSLLSAAAAKYDYAGDTTVTAGTLKLDFSASNSEIINNQSRLVLGGGAVEYATVAATTANDAVRDTVLISGASTLTKTGTGTGRLRLNTLNSQEVAGGTLNLSAAGIADTDTTNTAGIIGSRARFTVGSSGTYDWALNSTNAGDGSITAYAAYGALNLTAGTDTLNPLQALTSATTFTGSRTTNTLKLTNGSGSTQIVDITAANTLTLTAGGLLTTGTDAIELNNGTLKSNTGTNSDLIIHQFNSGGLTVGSVIANGTGASTLTKSGTGPLTLSGVNSYTGSTFLNGGTTLISANTNLGAPVTGASLILNNGTLRATADVTLSNGTIGTNNRSVNLNGIGGTFEVDDTRTLTIAGTISGPGGLTKTGTGTLDLRSTNYSGPTNVEAGTLRYGASFSNVYSTHNIGAAGTVDLFGFAQTIGGLSGSGTLTNSAASATLSAGANHLDSSFSGAITGAVSFEKMGGAVLTLTGSGSTYTGSTTVGGGTLALTGSGALPIGTATNTFNISSAAGTFDISGLSGSGASLRSLNGVAFSSVVLGGKTLTLSGAESVTYAGVISGAGGLTIDRSGTATQTLSGANTYDGVTSIARGVLQINSAAGLGSTGGNTVITSTGSVTVGTGTFGGQLVLNGGITVGENITIQGTGDANNFARALSATNGINTLNGTVTLTGTSPFRIGSGSGTFNVGLIQRSSASGGGIVFDPSVGSVLNINNAIDNNLGSLTAHAGGIVALNASNNDIGDAVVQNTTTLRIGAANALNTLRNLQIGQGILANGGTGAGNDIGILQLAGVSQTINALNAYPNQTSNIAASGSRLITNNTASTTAILTVGSNNGTGSFDGVIEDGAGLVALVKTGSGIQSLNGSVASTYSGTTLVSGGRLNVNNTVGGDTLTVASSSTLGGSGTIGAGVAGSTLQVNGTLAPGTSPGLITSNKPVSFNAGSLFQTELNSNTVGTGYDQLAAGSGVSISSTSLISLVLGYDPLPTDTFTLIDNLGAGPINGAFGNLANGGSLAATFGANSYIFQANYAGGTGNDLVLSVVPEVSGTILAFSGISLLALRRRRPVAKAGL